MTFELRTLDARSDRFSISLAEARFDPRCGTLPLHRVGAGIIKIVSRCGPEEHFGSGVIIDSLGHVLTAAHVIQPQNLRGWSPPLALLTQGVKTEEAPLRVVKFSAEDDLALMALPIGRRYQPLGLSPQTPNSGDRLFAVGFPNGVGSISLGRTVLPTTSAEVNQAFFSSNPRYGPLTYRSCIFRHDIVGGDTEKGNIVSTNAVDHGSSGGAIMNDQGAVLGVVVSFKREAEWVREDFGAIKLDLSKFEFPSRLAIARSAGQVRKFLDR